MSDQAVPSRQRARRRIPYLAGFWASGLALSGVYAGAGIGITCPFRALTGWDCPFCGATRMGAALLQGEWGAALAANPLVLIMLAVLAGFTVRTGLIALGQGSTRPSRRDWTLPGSVPAVVWVVAAALLSGVFMVARNLS